MDDVVAAEGVHAALAQRAEQCRHDTHALALPRNQRRPLRAVGYELEREERADAADVADQLGLVAQLAEFGAQPALDRATAFEVAAGLIGGDCCDARCHAERMAAIRMARAK